MAIQTAYNQLSRIVGPNTAEAWGYLGLPPENLPTGNSTGTYKAAIDFRNRYLQLFHEVQGQGNVLGYIPVISNWVGMARMINAVSLLVLGTYLQDSSTRDLAVGQLLRGMVEYSGFSYAINANADMAMTAFNICKRIVASTPLPFSAIAALFKSQQAAAAA